MKTKFLFSVLMFLFSNNLQAQTLFHKYVNDPQTTWYKADADHDETLLIGNDNTHITFLKLNANADTIWSRRFNNATYFSTAIAIPFTDARMNFTSWDNSKIYLSETDNFNFEWTKSYSYDTTLFHTDISQLLYGKHFSDGNIAIVGQTTVSTFGGDGYNIYPMITLTDSVGNIIWSRQFNIGNRCFEPTMIADRGNDLVVAGLNYTIYPVTSMPVWAVLIINKSDGAPIDDVKTILPSGELTFNTLSEDGNYLAGHFSDFSQLGTTSAVAKILDDGNIEWIKTITAATHPWGSIWSINKLSDNEIYIGGFAAEAGVGVSPIFFTGKINTDFESLAWAVAYSDTNNNGTYADTGVARFAIQVSDTNLIYWGTFTNVDVNGMNLAIKVNTADGLSSCMHHPLSSSVTEISFNADSFTVTTELPVLSNMQSETFNNEISTYNPFSVDTICTTPVIINNISVSCVSQTTVFPNPANDVINVFNNCKMYKNLSDIFFLYDAQGRIVKRFDLINAASQLHVNDLVEGLYYWKNVDKSNTSNGKIMVIKP